MINWWIQFEVINNICIRYYSDLIWCIRLWCIMMYLIEIRYIRKRVMCRHPDVSVVLAPSYFLQYSSVLIILNRLLGEAGGCLDSWPVRMIDIALHDIVQCNPHSMYSFTHNLILSCIIIISLSSHLFIV